MNQKLQIILCLFIFLTTQTLAQDFRVTGKVTGADNDAGVPGASILLKGTTSGTVTDIDGNYSLMAGEDATLVISYVGYETLEVPVEGRSNINVSLSPDIQSLSEIVVVGYGTQKKSDVISSVVSVQAEDMLKVPSTDIGEMLRGRAPGVFVTTGNAGPGGSSNILIRGKSSISTRDGANDPIVIVDGVPAGSINDINPNDIASTEILKDAAAQAIYGSRASNGVILITTKRGKAGKVNVNYNGFYGAQTVKRNFDVYSAEEFAQLKREAWRTDNPNQPIVDANIFTPTELEVLESGEFIDWEDELLRIAATQNHNVNVSAGTDKSSIYASLNYNNQEGVVPGTDFERVQLRVNVDQKINDWIKLGVNSSFQLSQRNNPGLGGSEGTLNRTVTTSPLGKIYNDDGTFRLNPTGVQESFNPLLDISEVSNIEKDRNDIINLFVDLTPFEGFKYRFNASRRSWNRKTENYATAQSLAGIQNGGLGQGYIRFEDNMEYQLENIFTYDKSFNEHNLGLTFVQSVTDSKYSNFRNNSSNIPNDLVGIYGIVGAQINTPEIGANRRGLLSFVGRVSYDYAGKYYITASARRDASTVFGANNKWGTFPAVGIGWNVHRESFLQNVGLVTNLKLRASYGSIGNQQALNPYQSLTTANQYDYVFDGNRASGYAPGRYLPNPDLKWETSTTLNLAADIAIWKSRLSGTVEFYNTRTKDLLVEQAIPANTGYSRRWYNVGEVENQGLELSLNAVAVETRSVTVNLGVQFSKNRNKIVSLYGDLDGDGTEDDDLANRWFIGQPVDVYYQYMPVGIWQSGEDIAGSHTPLLVPGDIKLFDRDPTDGELNSSDNVITSRFPDWYGSFFADVSFKGFDLSVNVLTVQGITKQNPYLYNYTNGGSLRGVLNGVKQNYWTPENTTGNWPRPRESNDPTFINPVMGLQDASYIRIQNVTLGYSLPESLLSRANLGKVRFYVTAQNPYTQTDYQSYSPEKRPDEYPEMISLIGGLQIGF